MKFVRETALEDAFVTMMNKLVFARKEILQNLLSAIEGRRCKNNTRRVNQIDEEIEALAERQQILTTIMTKGFLETVVFKQEMGRMISQFDADLFKRFVDRITVYSREMIIFHLKCGLTLRERIG